MSKRKVHIAGVGVTAVSKGREDKTKSALSAAVKALLDAGLNYDQVDFSIASGNDDSVRKALKALDQVDPRFKRAEGKDLLGQAKKAVTGDGSNCVLLLSTNKVSISICVV
jgi:hypothetical protein